MVDRSRAAATGDQHPALLALAGHVFPLAQMACDEDHTPGPEMPGAGFRLLTPGHDANHARVPAFCHIDLEIERADGRAAGCLAEAAEGLKADAGFVATRGREA